MLGVDIYKNYLPKYVKQNLYGYTFISEVGHFQELIEMFKDHASEIVLIPGRETDVQKKQRNHIKLVNVFNTFKINVTLI